MKASKITSIEAYRNQPWPEHTRRMMAAHMINAGVRRRMRLGMTARLCRDLPYLIAAGALACAIIGMGWPS